MSSSVYTHKFEIIKPELWDPEKNFPKLTLVLTGETLVF